MGKEGEGERTRVGKCGRKRYIEIEEEHREKYVDVEIESDTSMHCESKRDQKY